jgi:hypothetical protein
VDASHKKVPLVLQNPALDGLRTSGMVQGHNPDYIGIRTLHNIKQICRVGCCVGSYPASAGYEPTLFYN